MTQVAPAIHEVGAYLNYGPVDHPNAMVDYDGLDPYWFVRRLCIHVADGHHELDTEINGEPVTIRINYSDSGIAPHREHDVERDVLREFDINVRGRGERKVNYNLSPRFEGMRNSDGEPMTTAWDHAANDAGIAEGVSVHAEPTNLRLDEIPTLLMRALHELAQDLGESMYHGYFQQPFGGRIYALERYVRYHEQYEERVIGTGGVFDRLSSHLSDGAGTKGKLEWDNEGRKGKLQRLKHTSTDAELLVSRHQYGGQFKSYLPEHPEHFEPEDPLYHPKLGVKFMSGRSAGGAVDWADRHDLQQELDERLLSVLSWADVPLDPDIPLDAAVARPFVADDHFKARPAADPVALHKNPLPALEKREDDILARSLADMTDADEPILKIAATDGGTHVSEVADRAECSLSTVYRCLDRFDGVLESDNGYVKFQSQSLRRRIRALLDEFEDRVQSAAERLRDLVNLDTRQRASSAFDKWCAKYAADFEPALDGDDEPTIRIDTILSRYKTDDAPRPADVVREMVRAWETDGRDAVDIRNAILVYKQPRGGRQSEVVWSLI